MARFAFQFDPSYERLSKLFGVTPENAWVEVGDELFEAYFGRWRVRTPITNITTVEVTGPYRFWKTAGPARLGVTDLGLTFATNGDRGVLVTFRDKVPGMEPTGRMKHPELTVTVEDIDGLAALLRERISA